MRRLGPPKQRDLCDLRHTQLERVWNHYPVLLLHSALFWFQAWKAYVASPLSARLPTPPDSFATCGEWLQSAQRKRDHQCQVWSQGERGALSSVPSEPRSSQTRFGLYGSIPAKKKQQWPLILQLWNVFFFSCTFFRRLISWPSLCVSLIYPTHIVRTSRHSSGHNASATKPLVAPTDCGLKPNFFSVASRSRRDEFYSSESKKFVMKCFSKKPKQLSPKQILVRITL